MADGPDQWYLMVEKVREGPLSKQDIQYLLSQKQIDGTTLAWHKGLSTWDRLRDIEDFRPVRSTRTTCRKAAPSRTYDSLGARFTGICISRTMAKTRCRSRLTGSHHRRCVLDNAAGAFST